MSATRTAVGKFGGGLKDIPATRLGATVVREAVRRAGVQPGDVDECIMGNVLPAGLGQNPARQAALWGGLPDTVSALTFGYKMFDSPMIDAMVRDGLWDAFNNFHMGNTGEIVAQRHNVTRQDADAFAFRSHQRTLAAMKTGAFRDEVVPVEIPSKKGPTSFSVDEGPREDTSLESLAKLKPVFRNDGVLTAGNSSSINDGASALVVMDSDFAAKKGLKPLVRVVDYITTGTKPELLMEAPIDAAGRLMDRNSLSIGDIDLFEHNEAFSTASVALQRALKVPDDRFNVNGGAIALGHPIGCSGARVLTTLIYAMGARGAKRGLATLCLGGGNAVAMLVEK